MLIPHLHKALAVIGNGNGHHMLKKAFFIILSFISAHSALADKIVMPIEMVALEADIIVIGKIISVGKETYQFKVTEFIKGVGDSIITVQKFREWICDMRYASVAKGQHLFLFLEKSNGKFTLVNASTGEIPIINDSITLNNEINGHSENFQAIHYSTKISEFKDGIKSFIRCFKAPDDNYLQQTQLIQICNNQQLKVFINKNSFTNWLYKKIKKYYKLVMS